MRSAAAIWNGDASDQGENNSGISDGVRQNHVLRVNEDQREHRRGESNIEREREREAVAPGDQSEQQCAQRFDRRIARRDRRATRTATSAQDQKAEDRDVVVEMYGC